MKKSKIKVVVCGHDQKFWKPIQRELEKTNRFEFREDHWQGHDEHDLTKSKQCVEWADVIMAEWTMGNAVWYSKNKKKHQRLITRLHLQERNTPFPGKLKIDNVEQIVFVGKHIQEEVAEKFSIPAHKTSVISNFVDYQRYSQNKNPGAQFNLGIVGVVPMRKRLDLAVDLLERLLKADSRYCLHIKGPNPESYGWLWARTEEREYYQNLWARIRSTAYANRIIFHPAGDDVQDWFKNIGYLLSPSDFESFHMAVPEGLSSGTIPVVWNWEGAADIYRLLKPVDTIEEAEEWVLKMNHSVVGWCMAQQSKTYVKENFDINTTVSQWSELLSIAPSDVKQRLSDTGKPRNVLVFWLIDKWETFHRKEMIEALASNLAGNVEILVIEPGEDEHELIRRGWETKESLEQYANNNPQKVAAGIHRVRIVTNHVISKIGKTIGIDKYNQLKSGSRLSELVDNFYGKNTKILHWIYKPNQVERLSDGENDQFIYEIYDEYTRDFATGELVESIKIQEERICKKAKHVFFTAKTLEQRKQDFCTEHSTVSNGVNYDVFETFRVDESLPTTDGLRPSVGYLGNLSDFFDWNLVLEVARSLPDIDFYFHGNIDYQKTEHKKEAVHELLNLSNTVFTGFVTREQGAAAIARYNVLIIPFVVNEAMDAVNPLKLWEYFAAGRPVISTRMKATEHLSEIVYFADSVSQWCQHIEELTENPIEESVRTNQISLAKKNAWSELTKEHASIVIKLSN